ncbi:peptidylprolyl isomerase [Mesorhizobium microcysteis]|uniref:Parvulin-like PPIase n=1 Tax=Neoaquamicrobium microcysteis TaxID=2682781 RepID=A0A5D4GQ90_9HYPH|nr:peptidylprolyl isomerase [Mesorhizobium microcysteis]TYR30334.1 peptidylprolyl isomerase [Mesorhizobium microcysteis]
MKHPFRRLSIVRIGAAAAMIALSAPLALAQDVAPETVVATVNGTPITEADLTIAIADLEQQFAQLPEDQRRAAALSAVIEIRLLAAEAETKGLADGDDFNRRMDMLRQRALHSAYIDEEVANLVTDDAVRARYDEEIAKLDAGEEVRARHIIVPTQEEAAAIIEELNGGGDFEEIAKEKSQDGAAAQGGDLGYFASGQMVPEFEQAAFAMEVGAHSTEPVQTQFGWHVIKVEDKRAKQPPAFEQVSGQLRSVLLRDAYMQRVTELREAAEVEIADEGLKSVLEPAAGAEGGEAAPAQSE